MPRCPTTHVSEPKEWFPCLIANCSARFRSMNGHTQHIRAKHPSDEAQQDNLEDFPVVSETWPKSSSPQSEAMDEDNQSPDNFELLAFNSDQVSNTMPSDNNNFRPQSEEPPKNFSPSPPPSHCSTSPLQDTEESMHTEYHPYINGEYIVIKISFYIS